MSIVRIFIYDNLILGQPSGVFNHIKDRKDQMKSHGVIISREIERCDFILANQLDAELLSFLDKYHGLQGIICSNSLNPSFTDISVDISEVAQIWQTLVLHDQKPQRTLVGGKEHYAMINESEVTKTVDISSSLSDKIINVDWKMSTIPSSPSPPPTTERPIDVIVYCPEPNSANKFLKTHIADLHAKIASIRKEFSTLHIKTRPRDRDLSSITQAKIVVSPWSTDPFSPMDLKCIQAGAILLKPSMGTKVHDPYGLLDTMRECSPDFSDLQDVILSIMADYTSPNVQGKVNADTVIADLCATLTKCAQDIVES